MSLPAFECQCERCKEACDERPGWFLPGEIQPLAENLGITAQELFDNHLGVDWWEEHESNGEDVFVLAPAIKGTRERREYRSDPHGECKFFVEGKCLIHKLGKPYECAALNHESCENNHEKAADAWAGKEHQDFIEQLFGRKPRSKKWLF